MSDPNQESPNQPPDQRDQRDQRMVRGLNIWVVFLITHIRSDYEQTQVGYTSLLLIFLVLLISQMVLSAIFNRIDYDEGGAPIRFEGGADNRGVGTAVGLDAAR